MSEDEAAAADVLRAFIDGASARRAAAALLLLHLVADDADGDRDAAAARVDASSEHA